MTSTPRFAIDSPDGREYVHPTTGQRVPSVTTVLAMIDKPVLKYWFAKMVAEYAVEHLDAWRTLPPKDAVDLLKAAPRNFASNAADAGTNAHSYMESILKGEAPDEPEQSVFTPLHGEAFKNVRAILDELKPTPLALELTAWDHTHGYAGTFDGIHLIGGRVVLVDLKTNSQVFPEMAIQLAAYRYASHMFNQHGLEIEMPQVQACQIWHAPKQGTHKIVEMPVDYEEFAAFTAALDLWKWRKERAPLMAPKAPAKPRKSAAKKSA